MRKESLHRMANFLEISALKVIQPLGTFYVLKLGASQLLSVTFSEPMEYVDEFGKVRGSQRPKDKKRLTDIAKYIDSVEMAFPNSIILAANYTQKGYVSKDESERWKVIDLDNGVSKIIIPKQFPLAAIIDGQHRLRAFEFVTVPERFSELELVCSVYFDLPNSYQAFLFATINSNQKRVDRSLALEQFGFNVDDEKEEAWTPEKFSVFLSRKLNIDKNSPFHRHIKVAPLSAENLFQDGQWFWVISTATVVDGILSLISSNPKRDRIDMQQKASLFGRKRDLIAKTKDYSPMRKNFIEGQDQLILDVVSKYFKSIRTNLWNKANSKSYIIKTVGVQACFDILKMILKVETVENPLNIDFDNYIHKVADIDFSDKFFQASGIGRSRIKNTIGLATGLVIRDKVKKQDLPFYDSLFAQETTPEKEKWPWEENAEEELYNALEKMEWNFETKTISLFLDSDYDKPIVLKDYNSFFYKLVNIVEGALVTHLPSDQEFSEEMREKFDEEGLVNSYLAGYEDNLTKLGWI
jgi:DNA phosphorothioation-associated DGQHR protein 1